MNELFSEALREAWALAPAGEVYLETLQISHPSIPGSTVYLVKDLQNFVAFDEDGVSRTFEAAGFEMVLPPSGDNGEVALSISIDNTDKRISDFLNQAKEYSTPVKVTFRPYLATDPSGPQMDPPLTLNLTDIKVSEDNRVTGRATLADVLNKPFGTVLYRRSTFPGLANV